MNRLDALISRLDKRAVARMGAALWSNIGKKISVERMDWARSLLGEDGKQLIWEALVEASVITADRILEPGPLARFLEAISEDDHTASERYSSLVWTLPPQNPKSEELGGTYLRAIIEVIDLAQESLLMTSPFLREHGLASISQALLSALARGVAITILAEDVDNLASSQSLALEELRREAKRLGGCLIAYVTGPQVGTTLHAKLVIADTRRMVLGSANITGPGLGFNLEAGVVLGKAEAMEARAVVEGLIRSRAVRKVYDTDGGKR